VLGFLSDAHGHVGAFEKGLEVLREHGATHLFFLGDAVGYLPSRGVIEVIRRQNILCVRGNHDVGGPDDAGTEDFALWPLGRVLDVEAIKVQMVHGSPRKPLTEYVYPDTPLEELLAFTSADCVVMGHTHRPFVRSCGRVTFVNVGSCGLPRDDARFGSAVVFDPHASAPWRTLRFNIEEETRHMIDHEEITLEMREFFATRRSTQIVGEIVA
jgi:putative phosphoesterase